MKLILVHNAKSGSAMSRSDLLTLFRKNNITVIEDIQIGEGFNKKLQPYIDQGEKIAAVGGDGTISAVAGLVRGTQAALVPIPGGTLNHFTKDLSIPQTIEDAVTALARATEKTIDIATVNDTAFINNSSIGLYPQSLRTRESLEKTAGKWPAAVIAAVKTFFRFRSYTLKIDSDHVKTPFVFIGNNNYDFESGPIESGRTRLDEGQLSVYVIEGANRLQFARAIASSVLHGADSPYSKIRKVSALEVDARRRKKLAVSHDGELSQLATPLRYKIHKDALRVLY